MDNDLPVEDLSDLAERVAYGRWLDDGAPDLDVFEPLDLDVAAERRSCLA
jgi:hypothetical protein